MDKEEIRLRLAAEYELGEIEKLSPLLVSEPERTDLLKIEGQGKAYALKLQSPIKREPQFLLEAHLLSWLADHDFALVPPVMHSRSGHPFARLNGKHCILTAFVTAKPDYDWREAAWSEAVCRQGGEALGHLHNQFAALTAEELRAWGYEADDAPPSLANTGRIGVGSVRPHISLWLNQAIARFCQEHAPEGLAAKRTVPDQKDIQVAKDLIERRQLWTELLEASETKIRANAQLSQMMIHGDYHPGNAIWSGDSVQAIVDFENSHMEHPLYDVAYALIMFSTRWHRHIDFIPSKGNDWTDQKMFSGNLAQQFLAGYMKTSLVVTDTECEKLLEPFLQIAGSVILYWMLLEHQSKSCYRNLIEVLVAYLDQVGRLASV